MSVFSVISSGRQGNSDCCVIFFFFSSRRRHTRSLCDWSSDVCSSDLVMEGRITPHSKIRLVYTNQVHEVETLGTLTPKPVALEELEAGDVGFVVANIKDVADARMGDTITEIGRASCRERV